MLKKQKVILVGTAILIFLGLVLALGWYYQKQGLIKIFPTSQERQIKAALVIDETKFRPAEGLKEEKFKAKIAELYELKKKILADADNPVLWFDFGYLKEFLNDHQGATKAWEISFALQSYDFRTALNLGNVNQYFLKDYPKAEYYYLKALEVRPDLTSAYQGLADLYRFNWLEKKDKFEPIMLKAVKEDSVNQAIYYVNLVEFFAKDNPSKAKEYLAEIKELKPEAASELLESYPALR